MKDDNEITNNQLADMIAAMISASASELNGRMDSLESAVRELRAGMFTPEEKETLLNMVDHINERLENDALGKGDITLTRPEYDATAVAANFLNRFERPREAWAE